MIPYVNLFRIDNFFFFFEILMLYIYIYIYIPTIVGATIPAVRSPILVVWWLETSIWRRLSKPLLQQSAHLWWQYDGRRHQSAGGHQSHYFGSLGTGGVCRNHYFNNQPTGGLLFGGTTGGETNLVAFVRATILTIWPSPTQVAPLAEPPVLVGYLKYKFKLKKYDY